MIKKVRYFHLKYVNKILNYYLLRLDILLKRKRVISYPVSITINTTNKCNLRCKFCEIHYFYNHAKKVSGRIFYNSINKNVLKSYNDFFKNSFSIHLSGAIGEPFVNPSIFEIISFLKSYNLSMTMDTNGLLINHEFSEKLIESKFDTLNVSIHGGDKETYKKLHGGNFDVLLSNIEYLIQLRNKKGQLLPKIIVNFALNTQNAPSLTRLMDICKKMGVDSLHIFHYYGSRNAINSDISFDSKCDEGNRILNDAYAYAQGIKLNIIPEKPHFFSSPNSLIDKPSTKKTLCYEPWNSLKIKGCIEENRCSYIGVCNRIQLIKFDYELFNNKNEGHSFFKNVWNSQVVQYFRETVNSSDGNPICNFCRDPNTPKYRCLYRDRYMRLRDQAVEDFFIEYKKRYPIEQKISGIEVLHENPYKFKEEDGFLYEIEI